MRYADYSAKSVAVRSAALLALIAVFAFVPMLADRWVYDNWYNPRVYDVDWGRLIRQMGWFPT
ncbi:MAG: hypothetical protein FJ202_13045, partial [Gemmatimonadetes bacterium]|nr:hypothetical protein [Gemmatimonadota bacterium]